MIVDIVKDEDVKRLVESTVNQFGKIDVLANNAGAGWLTDIMDTIVMENYEKVMNVDLRAVVCLLIKQFLVWKKLKEKSLIYRVSEE